MIDNILYLRPNLTYLISPPLHSSSVPFSCSLTNNDSYNISGRDVISGEGPEKYAFAQP